MAHRIVIVGGGAGGLELMTKLSKSLKACNLTLVDRVLSHVWKPQLHEVAVGTLNRGEDETFYFPHAFHNGYQFVPGSLSKVDLKSKQIIINSIASENGLPLQGERALNYDTLIIAVGSEGNDFGTPGVKDYCFNLDNLEASDRLRNSLFDHALKRQFMKTESCPPLRIGVVGAGPSGVELCIELFHSFMDLKNLGDNYTKDNFEVYLLEAAPRVLPGVADDVAMYTTNQLTTRGIKVLVNTGVAKATPEGFVLRDGSNLPCDIKVWVAGVKGPDFIKTLPLEFDARLCKVVVNDQLRTSDANIFGLGDCAKVLELGTTNFCPPTAQVAHQESDYLFKLIKARVAGKAFPDKFAFVNKGIIVALGQKKATATVNLSQTFSKNIHGYQAKVLYEQVHRMHQAAIHGWSRTIIKTVAEKLRNIKVPQVKAFTS